MTWRLMSGTIDRATAQDIDEMLHEAGCSLDRTTWLDLCSKPEKWEQRGCPLGCRIDEP